MKIKIHICLVTLILLSLLALRIAAQSCTVVNASPRTFDFPASGGNGSVTVQTNPSNCTDYSFSQVGTFFTAYKSSFGISITCNQNTTGFSRTGRVNVGEIVIQVNQAALCPSQNPPGPITGASSVCINGSATYSTSAVSGATFYSWSVNGGSITDGQGTLNAVIRFTSSGTRTVSVTARNSCGSVSTSRTYNVNVVANPAAPTNISHNPALCVGSDYTFSVTQQTGLTYEWAVEGNNYQLLSGQGPSSIQVRIGSGTGTIKVKAVNSAGCKSAEYSKPVTGEGGAQVFNVSGNGSICPGASTTVHLDGSAPNQGYTAYYNDGPVTGESASAVISLVGNGSPLTFGPFTKAGTYTIKATAPNCPVPMNGNVPVIFKPAIPDQPGSISANKTTLCINEVGTFSIAAVPRATKYTWSAPGATVISGQETTNVQIRFNSSGNPVTVSVIASNECGNSIARTTPINVVANPAAPTNISHNPALCVGSDYTFSVAQQTGLTYEWAVEGNNYQLLSGQGPSSIQVRIGSGTGTIKVKAVNSAGCKSAEYSKPVTGEGGAQVFNVSGNGSICPGASTTVHLDGSAPNQGYTAYYNDGPITGESASAVISLVGNSSPLTFGPFTKEGTYTIKATAPNCPVPMNGNVPVIFKPAIPDQPGSISANKTSFCINEVGTFSIAEVPRATKYTWSAPGATVISGQETTNVQIRFNSLGNPVTVSVIASNECGNSIASSIYISVPLVSKPTFLPSQPNPCAGQKYGLRVEPVAGYTYNWQVPNDWEILGGQGTSSIQVKIGRYDGTILVTADKNGCSSETASKFMDIVEPTGVFALTGSLTICEGESFNLNLSGSVIGNSYTLIRGESNIITKPGTNGPLTFGPYSEQGTYKVYSRSLSDLAWIF